MATTTRSPVVGLAICSTDWVISSSTKSHKLTPLSQSGFAEFVGKIDRPVLAESIYVPLCFGSIRAFPDAVDVVSQTLAWKNSILRPLLREL